MDKQRIEAAVREILIAIGEDPDREGLVETPSRVARMYEEIFGGLEDDPTRHLKLFDESSEEMVVVRDIPLYSMCEHHLIPFLGKAHIAYIPSDGRVIGLSKLARIVDCFEAEHLCMTMRGARASGAKTMTSALRGTMRSNAKTRAEAMSLLTEGNR